MNLKNKLLASLAIPLLFASFNADAKFCYKLGISSCSSTQQTPTTNPTPTPTPSLSLVDGAYTDGKSYAACLPIKQKYPESKSGIYKLESGKIYCDMETDGGGWSLAIYLGENQKVPPFTAKMDTLVKGLPLITATTNPTQYPVLSSGQVNNSTRILFKGGGTLWKNNVGEWFSFDTKTLNTPTTITTTLTNVKNQSTTLNLYLYHAAWGRNSDSLTENLTFVTANNNKGICGGDNKPTLTICPFLSNAASFGKHFESTSEKFLFIR